MQSRIRKCVFALLALAAGCAGPSEKGTAPSYHAGSTGPGGVAAIAPKIVDVVSRDNVVTIVAGPAGPLYTARTRTGQLLFADATLDQVQVLHPDVYRQIDGAAAASADHVIDASIDVGLP